MIRMMSERNRHSVNVQCAVSDEADMTVVAHTHNGRTFTPDHIGIEYRKRDGSLDGPWIFANASVSGYLHKKDGTPGLQRGTVYFFGLDRAPRWVRMAIKDHRPDPLLHALTGPLTGPYGGPGNGGTAGPDSDRRGALRLALSRMTDEQVATLATALTDAAQFVAEDLADRITARHKAGGDA